MCRKKVSHSDQLALFAEQGIRPFEPFEDRRAQYNLTAGYSSDVILYQDEEMNYRLKEAHWGLIPFWVKGDLAAAKKASNSMVNARAETVREKPAYKNLVAVSRCIIPTQGFYEWHHITQGKKDVAIPFYISSKDCKGFGIAGLHADWVDRETGEVIKSFSMITTAANEIMARIHNHGENQQRMPLILPPCAFKPWLDRNTPETQIDDMLAYLVPVEQIDAWPVNKIGPRSIDGPEMIERVSYEQIDWA